MFHLLYGSPRYETATVHTYIQPVTLHSGGHCRLSSSRNVSLYLLTHYSVAKFHSLPLKQSLVPVSTRWINTFQSEQPLGHVTKYLQSPENCLNCLDKDWQMIQSSSELSWSRYVEILFQFQILHNCEYNVLAKWMVIQYTVTSLMIKHQY